MGACPEPLVKIVIKEMAIECRGLYLMFLSLRFLRLLLSNAMESKIIQ